MFLSNAFKRKPWILLIALLVAHWVAVSLNEAPGQGGRRLIQVWVLTVFAPLEEGFTWFTSGISNTWNNYFALRGAKEENKYLHERNAQLESEIIRLRDAQQRVASLEAQLNLKQTQPYQSVQARVVGRDANQWFNTVIIDHGSFSGVAEGQPVLTSEGLVGRVIHAAPNAARVLLLTDERSGAGAVIGQLADSRVLGVVRGKNASLCEMKIVSAGDVKIQPGEVVLTSGQDGIYPRGLIIGRVARVAADAGGNPAQIEIAPAAALARLETVSVLQVSGEQIRASRDEIRRQEQERLEKERQSKTAGPRK